MNSFAYVRVITIVMLAMALTGCIRFYPTTWGWYYNRPNIDTVAAPDVDTAALRRLYPNDAGVMLGTRIRAKEKLWERGEDNYVVVRAHRYVILDPKADWLTNISETFHRSVKVVTADVMVFHPDGQREHYGLDDFTVTSSSEYSRLYRLPIRNATAGTVVDMCFVLSSYSSMNFCEVEPIYMRYSIPSLGQEVYYTWPVWSTFIDKKIPEDAGAVPTRSMTNDEVTYVVGPQPAAREEQFSPEQAVRWARLDFCARPQFLYGYKSTGSFWSDHGRLMYSEYFKSNIEDSIDDPGFATLHASILNGATTRVDTLQRLKTWFSSNVKIDYSDTRPESAGTMLRDRAGSLWGGALLARELYMRAGFRARIVQLHSLEHGQYDPQFTNFSEFREVALVVDKDSVNYLVLFQRPLQPVGVVPSEYVDQPYVYIDTDQWERTPVTGVRFFADSTTTHRNVTVELNDDGTARVEVRVTHTGESAYSERITLDDLPQSELETSIKKELVPSASEATDVVVGVDNLEDPTKPLIVRATFTIPDAVTRTPSEIIFQTAGFLSPASEGNSVTDTTQRLYPIIIPSDYRYQRDVEIRYPASWNLQTSVGSAEVLATLGSLERTIRSTSGSLVMNFSSRLRAGTYPKDRAQDLRKVLADAGAYAIPTLVFTTN